MSVRSLNDVAWLSVLLTLIPLYSSSIFPDIRDKLILHFFSNSSRDFEYNLVERGGAQNIHMVSSGPSSSRNRQYGAVWELQHTIINISSCALH